MAFFGLPGVWPTMMFDCLIISGEMRYFFACWRKWSPKVFTKMELIWPKDDSSVSHSLSAAKVGAGVKSPTMTKKLIASARKKIFELPLKHFIQVLPELRHLSLRLILNWDLYP